MTTGTSETHGLRAAHRRRIRNYLLDSHFQLKYASFLVSVAIVISALMGGVLHATTRAMVVESVLAVEESRKAAEESKKVSAVTRMNVRDLAAESPELVAAFEKEADAYDKVIAEHENAAVAHQVMLLERQRRMLTALVGGLTLMVLAIGLLGIYFTHKVAGPVFKMRRLLRQVGEGNLQVDARLRKGDELKSFFDSFTNMVAALRDRDARQLDEIGSAIDALGRGDALSAATSLERLRQAIRKETGS
jgi:methyl-accepting chemotaxis protein